MAAAAALPSARASARALAASSGQREIKIRESPRRRRRHDLLASSATSISAGTAVHLRWHAVPISRSSSAVRVSASASPSSSTAATSSSSSTASTSSSESPVDASSWPAPNGSDAPSSVVSFINTRTQLNGSLEMPDDGAGGRSDGVLICPGYFADVLEYIPLAQALRDRGFDVTIAPIRWYHWIPTLGGRSVRPILDRLQVALAYACGLPVSTELEEDFAIQLPDYSFQHWIAEMRDASKGSQQPLPRVLSAASPPSESSAAPAAVDSTAVVTLPPKTTPAPRKVAVVAHSAAGWIARLLMGSKEYGGKVYGAASMVHTLVTLGTPHISADSITRRNLEFVNSAYPGCCEDGVRYVCVGGRSVKGTSTLGGLIQDLPYQSYVLCCGKGDVYGDSVVPIECALALDGATRILLDGVEHAPSAERQGRRWYGSEGALETWLPFLHPPPAPGVGS